jgi:hypothetical protein
MTNVFYAILAIVVYAHIAKTSISFSPFSISMERPFYALAFVLLLASIFCFRYDVHKEAYQKGLIMGSEIQKEVYKEQQARTNKN